MKVVVTGASGLLGRAVKAEFTKTGHEGNIPGDSRCIQQTFHKSLNVFSHWHCSEPGRQGWLGQGNKFTLYTGWTTRLTSRYIVETARFDRFQCCARVHAKRKTKRSSSLRRWATTGCRREGPWMDTKGIQWQITEYDFNMFINICATTTSSTSKCPRNSQVCAKSSKPCLCILAQIMCLMARLPHTKSLMRPTLSTFTANPSWVAKRPCRPSILLPLSSAYLSCKCKQTWEDTCSC